MTDDLQALLEKARRCIGSAELLRAAGDYGSATSRLSYAMFYCAEALLRAKGQTRTSHRGVIAAFWQQWVKTGELPAEMHQWLLDGFRRRQLADYQPLPTMTDADVRDLQPKAEQFLVKTGAFLRAAGY